MKKMIASCALLALAGAANAAVVSQTLPWGFPLSPGADVLAFNKFNGALGTLTKVEMIFAGSIDADATAENDSVLSAPAFALNLSGNMSVTFQTLVGVGIVNTNFAQALDPTDNGGVANGSGPDFYDFGPVGDSIGGMMRVPAAVMTAISYRFTERASR